MYTLESHGPAVIFACGERRLRVQFVTSAIVRVTVTEGRPFKPHTSLIVETPPPAVACTLEEQPEAFVLRTAALRVHVARATGALSYFDAADRLLVREPERGGKWLTPRDVIRNVYRKDAAIAAGQSIDGARANVEECDRVFDRHAFEAKLEFVFSPDEALFGFGSHEEGYGNLRGKARELYQQNMKAVVPYFVSTRNYGVLLDAYSLMTFHDDAFGSYVWAEVVDELDYYVITGDSFDAVTRGCHLLTGPTPMLPKWAFGYTQSKERYVNAREMLDVVREYRRRRIPLDVIVLDWKSWPNGNGWGQKSFDPVRFPDPPAFTAALHDLGARLMVSIWPIMTGDCPNQRELLERDLMLGNQATYNAFSPEARACYWEQANRGLFAQGIDAWWCDCTEPFEADWSGAVKPEPHHRLAINTGQARRYLDEGCLSAYSLLHSKGIYEGQRRATAAKRVINLTRSSYAGQHRYGTITWSGDICATWETLRRSIPEGLNFCVTGEPYWSVDIGGFFINHDPKLWFWRGDYADGCRGLTEMTALEPDPKDTGCQDRGYWELYTRWLQYGAFLPIFRSHGTDAAREIWRFGEAGTPFYDTIAEYIRLRYELLPYIYSAAAQVTLASATLMRPLALDFPADPRTHAVTDQFRFGPSLMVCPVTQPMYFGPNSTPIEGAAKSRSVYLPAGTTWCDFWTGAAHKGGRTIEAAAPLETIPVFVPAGTILPLSPEPQQYTDEKPDAPYEIRIYAGANGTFDLYEDAGDSYAYEQGAYSLIRLTWKQRSRRLTIGARQGTFPTQVTTREYRVVLLADGQRTTKTVTYTGAALTVAFQT
ncbi:glycoside hydrolase family 31 protein [Opitutus sp. ER46]|uniref:glycoside hydrolase family 31 protein n=1 Tax=Opitutus sp. ER46 TaxID=2161864 RepID=UPI000D2FB086|nr:glycoside hydrolase family 31 protein [Opitutus sp. ER46]PTY00126.1 glycoside hydrolase [Opitutus sp. ER46]